MRRHSAMDFVAGVMVFPGGGVDDRDRNADVAWFGPEPRLVGRAVRRRTGSGRGVGVCRGPRDVRRVRCAVRRAGRRPGRHRRRRVDLPRIAAGAGGPLAVVRGVPAPGEPRAARGSAAAVGELGDAERGAHPSLRHLLLRRGIAGRPARRRRQHRNRPRRLDHARRKRSRTSRSHGRSCCRRRGRSWTRWPGALSPKCLPWNVRSSPSNRILPRRTATGRSSSSTATATTTPATTARLMATALTRRLHERVRLRPHQR